MNEILKKSNDFAEQVYPALNGLWATVSKADLEKDGRTTRNNPPSYTERASYLYVAYENSNVLYVGEASTSIRDRFIAHGSGAHNKKNWYQRMTHVEYIKATFCELPEKHRMLLEQALSIKLNPEFYG